MVVAMNLGPVCSHGNGVRSAMFLANLASQGLLLPHGATAKTLVPSGHVNPQILGVIRIAASLPFREEW